jgi:hypothetical protein
MRAAELITLASAHGIDLTQAAKQTTRVASQRSARFAKFRPKLELEEANACVDPPLQSAVGRQSHVVKRAEWSIAELGQAAQGVSRIPFLAVMYAYAGDRSCYWPLHSALTMEALEMRARRGWSVQVKAVDGSMRYYIEQLAALVLDEDANQPLFRAAPVLYALCLNVAPDVWEKTVAHRFEQVKQRYMGWLAIAESAMNEKLTDEQP